MSDLRSDEAVVDIRYLSKLTQAEDQVLVYFNNDDLLASSAQNREFYRLISTGGTGNVADDLILVPHSVAYYPDRDMAVLRFDDDSDGSTPYRLPHGTYRLEIGESEETNNLTAVATIVGTLFAGADYQKVATLEGLDRDIYRIELPTVSDLHITVTPDAELTVAGASGHACPGHGQQRRADRAERPCQRSPAVVLRRQSHAGHDVYA